MHSFFGLVSIFKPFGGGGRRSVYSEDTALALSSVQDVPFSTSSTIYSAQACWIEFLLFHKTCGVLRPRTIWALASSPHPSDILNVFGLIIIETTPHEGVSIMLRIIMFWPWCAQCTV